MTKKIGFWEQVRRFFMRFNMCNCTSPEYTITRGILCCNSCHRAVSWQDKPNQPVVSD